VTLLGRNVHDGVLWTEPRRCPAAALHAENMRGPGLGAHMESGCVCRFLTVRKRLSLALALRSGHPRFGHITHSTMIDWNGGDSKVEVPPSVSASQVFTSISAVNKGNGLHNCLKCILSPYFHPPDLPLGVHLSVHCVSSE